MADIIATSAPFHPGSAGCQPAVRGSLPRTLREVLTDINVGHPAKLPDGGRLRSPDGFLRGAIE